MNEFQTYKMIVAYDGTDFFGWQAQPHGKTIVNCLQDTFKKVFDYPISVVGASRTDTGVHAAGQVAKFMAPRFTDVANLMRAWNASLPPSVLLRSMIEVPHGYNPQKNVVSKTYYYHLFINRPLPFFIRFGWHYEYIDQVDWDKFNKALQLFRGEHDFAAFCRKRDDDTTVRTVNDIFIERVPQFRVMRVVVKGPGFLHHQIRRMVGAALDVARQPEVHIEKIKHLLEAPTAEEPFLRAEGCGLMLRRIIYK